MTIFPGMIIRHNYGLVDVHLIRRVRYNEEIEHIARAVGEPRGIELAVDDIVADLNEILRTRVRSLGGNCLIGYKVSIDSFEQDQNDQSEVQLIMSAIGDAVLLEEEQRNIKESVVSAVVSDQSSQEEQKLQSPLPPPRKKLPSNFKIELEEASLRMASNQQPDH